MPCCHRRLSTPEAVREALRRTGQHLDTCQWDLIAAIFEPDTKWVRQICAGLNPGGLFVRENYVFSKEDNEPLKQFIELRILRFEDRLDDPDYHPDGENGKPERVQRMLAQKV